MNTRFLQPHPLTDWLLLAFLIWLGSYGYLYLYQASAGPKPLYSYFLLLGFGAFYLLYRSASGLPLTGSYDARLYGFLAWLALYLVYGAFEFLRSTEDSVAVQAFIALGEAVLLAGAFALLMSEARRLPLVVGALAFLALLGTAVNIFDFINPVFSKVPGRAAGMYVNPTVAGNFIALAMVGGLTTIRRNFRLPYLLFCGAGVIVTFSRESWIIWGLAVIYLGWQGYIGNARRRLLMIVLVVVIGGGFTTLLFAGQIGALVAKSSLQSFLTPNTQARLGIGGSSLSGHAAEQRENLVHDSLNEFAVVPWLGHGLGYTREWRYSKGPHDMYLLFLVEGGIFGALLYPSLLLLLWQAGVGVGRVITLQIIVSSFFTHNHLEQPAILIMMAFVIAHGAVTRAQTRQKKRDPVLVPA